MTDGEAGGGFLERLRNSPRTVSTIIVILIVVGAIFAFSDRGEQPRPLTTPTPTAIGEVSPTPEGVPPEEEATPTPATTDAVTEAEPTPVPSPLPEARETDAAYVEVAVRGDGVTHLARRAMLRYFEGSPADFEVTAEHKVWIEDFIKDRIGSQPLGLGEQVEVSKDLVREAIGTSKALTDAQLKSLERFSQLVAAYR